MRTLTYACMRVRALLTEIERLKDSDFPYPHAAEALDSIEQVFNLRLKELDALTDENSEDVVRTACSESLLQVFRYLPRLGFILRSTDVRNSFEVFGPLLRLANQILGSDSRLIVSSEWNFSPHIYPPFPELPNFVFLGLPASESGNPLLLPLAGHELGHTTWQFQNLGREFKPRIEQFINDESVALRDQYEELFSSSPDDPLFRGQNLLPAYAWAQRQVEETFCDLMGLRLFSEAYLHAFAYVLTPGGQDRNAFYPSMRDRVANLLGACDPYGVKPPDNYAEWFINDVAPTNIKKDLFLLDLADRARDSVIPGLLSRADEISDRAAVPVRSQEKSEAIRNSFRLVTPAANVGDLTNILNAAWIAFHDHELESISADDLERTDVLFELVLKSIEILEIEYRTK